MLNVTATGMLCISMVLMTSSFDLCLSIVRFYRNKKYLGSVNNKIDKIKCLGSSNLKKGMIQFAAILYFDQFNKCPSAYVVNSQLVKRTLMKSTLE